MKSIVTAAVAALMLTGTIVTADTADARHRRDRDWNNHHGHHGYSYRKHRRHRQYVRHRHHRFIHRGGIVVRIIVLPGQPYYYGCGGYCW